MKIIFFGTGAVAAELTSYLDDDNWRKSVGYEIKGYVASDEDGIINWEKYKFRKPFLGLFESYKIEKDDYFILALGNYEVKHKIVDEIVKRGGNFINLIHPTAIVAKTAKIGKGNILCPHIIIGPNVTIGDFNLMTSQTIISHDSIIGDFNFFATALLCGHTTVGNDNYCGIRVTTVPDVKIGNRNKIQAGMIIDKNVEDDAVVFYRYKEKISVIYKYPE